MLHLAVIKSYIFNGERETASAKRLGGALFTILISIAWKRYEQVVNSDELLADLRFSAVSS